MKVRTTPKKVKHKRSSKKSILLGNVSVSTIKDLGRFHHKGVNSRTTPLRGGQFLGHRGIHTLLERPFETNRLGICVVGSEPSLLHLTEGSDGHSCVGSNLGEGK